MAKQITKWVSEDGTEFYSEKEANDHSKYNALRIQLLRIGVLSREAEDRAAYILERWPDIDISQDDE